ncbi:hypothetical protein K9M47_00500 [Candidatus Gracilibacteria bacterium]|nr:hypothetical protein [Candidatus Gracilibacteria bacterium]MCF7898622.1 hypothetical protein [Candidatus Paceibacterota bacterium]
MKNIPIVLFTLIIIISAYVYINNKPSDVYVNTDGTAQVKDTVSNEQKIADETTSLIDKSKTIVGSSVEKNNIVAYHYGNGAEEVLFVGGIHGGYEWNTVLVAYQLMDYLKANPNIIPSNLKVTVIPVMNPDGLKKVVGTTERFSSSDVSSSEETVTSGRFNANNVDLSRNFDCDWKSKGTWQNKTVSGGTKVFSEPESLAIKSYVENNKITAAVVWYSAAGGVFASSCHNGVSDETSALTKKFASASKYPAYDSFDFYATTGDMVNWLAKKNIPAISVLLTNHEDTEWSKNKAGVDALLKYYAK